MRSPSRSQLASAVELAEDISIIVNNLSSHSSDLDLEVVHELEDTSAIGTSPFQAP